MGTWGTGIFQDDLACDIRDQYVESIDNGYSKDDATDIILQEYKESISDPDEAGVVWLALAATQLKFSPLLDIVKERALEVINSGIDLNRWEDSPVDLGKRKNALNKLFDDIHNSANKVYPVKKRRKKAKFDIGDVFMIPLPDGRKAYAHFVYLDTGTPASNGDMVRVLDFFTDNEVSISELIGRGELFPPVFVCLNVAIKYGKWKNIGNIPVKEFRLPLFRTTSGLKAGVFHNWYLWDRGKEVYIGDLPEKYYSLEILCVWSHDLLSERIMTGYTIGSEKK